MTSLDTGTYGAKVQSWKRANPRDLLKRLIDNQPAAGRDAIFQEFREYLRGDDGEDFLDSVIEYWFANNYHSLIERPAPSRAAQQTERRVAVEKVKETIRARLLDMRLPNGLTLAASTFGYCAKLGGGLARIGAKGKPNQVVGKHLSETEVRKLYSKAEG